MQQQQKDTEKNYTFPQKAWIVGGILALITVILLLLRATFSVLLLILAGTLIAVYFRGLSGLLERKTKWKTGVCLTISILGTLILVGLLFWLIGAKVQAQIAELGDQLPATVENAKNQLNKSPLGQKVVQKISSPKTQERAQAMAQSFFRSTFGVLGDIYVVLFIGIFFTVSTKIYKAGIVKLIP
ncbi:MAG: AI-2E family transporter, partial [Flavisolibacter sp.]|nr:AI-2E family transporter [Flavisolibacter sp.]